MADTNGKLFKQFWSDEKFWKQSFGLCDVRIEVRDQRVDIRDVDELKDKAPVDIMTGWVEMDNDDGGMYLDKFFQKWMAKKSKKKQKSS